MFATAMIFVGNNVAKRMEAHASCLDMAGEIMIGI